MDGQAFLSQRIVTPDGIRPGAILVREGKIDGIVPADEIPAHAAAHDFGESAILPGLVDSHIHLGGSGGGSTSPKEFAPSRVVRGDGSGSRSKRT